MVMKQGLVFEDGSIVMDTERDRFEELVLEARSTGGEIAKCVHLTA